MNSPATTANYLTSKMIFNKNMFDVIHHLRQCNLYMQFMRDPSVTKLRFGYNKRT